MLGTKSWQFRTSFVYFISLARWGLRNYPGFSVDLPLRYSDSFICLHLNEQNAGIMHNVLDLDLRPRQEVGSNRSLPSVMFSRLLIRGNLLGLVHV